jgi:hypothetical protein
MSRRPVAGEVPPTRNPGLQAPDEYYNVDDFFGTYLNELTQRAAVDPNELVPQQEHGVGMKRGAAEVPLQEVLQGTDLDELVQDLGILPQGSSGIIGSDYPSERRRQTGTAKSGRQQQANKVAQQRYRERKKQKYAEMEKTVENMKEKLANLQALTKRNAMLEQMNSNLQAQMIEKETELERLKASLDAQSDASLHYAHSLGTNKDSSEDLNGHGDQPKDDQAACGACGPCDVLPRDLNGIDFKTGFADQIELLKRFMNENDISYSYDEKKDAMLSDEKISELAALVGRCCQLCQAAIRAEGVRVLDLIKGSLEEWKNKGGDPKWDQVLKGVQLRAEQEQEMLMLRASHLDKMKEIYSERQQLNLDAVSKMIPHSSSEPEKDMTVNGRMTSMSSGTYLPLARNNAELNEILDKIKHNLRREQRATMDLNCCTISKIMTPLQSARYMVNVYPLHCDALALSNALARQREAHDSIKQESGAEVGRASSSNNVLAESAS